MSTALMENNSKANAVTEMRGQYSLAKLASAPG
jgi:hypothetical protein